MKKNRMMRLASVMLVAVLMTTCTISGTFAKYVTEDSSTDIARVAKWGVEITPNGTVFNKVYATDDTTTLSKANSVSSNDTWNVVAPGTKGNLTTVVLEGKPEVAYKVEYDATLTLNGWSVDGEEYFPVYFTIGSETYGHKTCGHPLTYRYDSIDLLKASVETALKDYSDVYGANVDLTTVTKPDLEWEWPFFTSDANDVKDTALGDAADAGYHAVIKIDIVTTVTQVD